MHVTYTGKTDDLTPVQRQTLETRYQRLSRHLDGQGQKEAHVVLTQERYLHNAEIVVNFLDHGLVGRGSDPDLFTAVLDAVSKLEKQVNRLLGKRRESYREGKDKFRGSGESGEMPRSGNGAATSAASESGNGSGSGNGNGTNGHQQIHEVDVTSGQKPMDLDEALLHMQGINDYFAFIDSTTDHLAVLIRRGDGHVDLVRCQ